jgi:site-specific DNA-methyltransferase (adenine-specific)
MNIQQLDIGAIKPYDKNPRKNDKAVEAVANSLEQYGFQQPIVVDKDMIIIVGHTRYKAAKKLNFKQIPVLVAAELTSEQAQAYRIMDNRSGENARWDDELLLKELEDLLKDNDITGLSYDTGLSEAELNKLFSQQEDPVEEYNKEPEYKSRTGDLWILGAHRLLNGDSTKQADVQRLMQNDKIDLLWEDPPYGVSYETINGINYSKEENDKRNHKIANDNLTPEQLDQFLEQHMSVLDAYIKPGSAVYWCHDIRFTEQFKKILERFNYHISDTLIWKKDRHSTFLSDYAKFYEPILYGWRQGQEHNWYGNIWNPNAIDMEKLDDMSKEQLIKIIKNIDSNYQEFAREKKDVAKLHPTVKPVKLIVYHLYNSTKSNDIVYDGFAGSGSTLIAAEQANRQARCIEFEPKFIDVIIKRWQEQTGKQAVREDGALWDDIVPEQDTAKLAEFFNMEATK